MIKLLYQTELPNNLQIFSKCLSLIKNKAQKSFRYAVPMIEKWFGSETIYISHICTMSIYQKVSFWEPVKNY